MQRTAISGNLRRGRRRGAGRRRRLANFRSQTIQIVRRATTARTTEIDDAVIAGSRRGIASQPTTCIDGADISVLAQAEEGSISWKGDDDITGRVHG